MYSVIKYIAEVYWFVLNDIPIWILVKKNGMRLVRNLGNKINDINICKMVKNNMYQNMPQLSLGDVVITFFS